MYSLHARSVSGAVNLKLTLRGLITSEKKIIGNAKINSKLIGNVTLGTSNVHQIYEGRIIVIPSAHDKQILPTSQKLLTDDITVNTIPYAEVTNLADGITVTIA